MTSKLITEEHPLLVAPQLAATFGSVDAAIVLQQIHYWLTTESGRIIDGVRWIYNRLDDWLEQFPWMSKWQLRKTMAILRDEFKVVIFAQHEAREWKRRGWYTIDYEALGLLHTSMCEVTNPRELVSPSIEMCAAHISEAENTSEISQKIHQQSAAASLEKSVEQEVSDRSLTPLVDRAELADDESELIGEDHSSDAPELPEKDPDEYRQILSEVRAADIPLSPELQRLVVKSSYTVVQDALAALLERRQKGTVTNPAGYLTRAIQGQWKPTSEESVKHKSAIPDEMNPILAEQKQLLDKAKSAGKILDHFFSASDGIHKVVMPGGFVMKPWWEFLG